jgi:hypothetical protein
LSPETRQFLRRKTVSEPIPSPDAVSEPKIAEPAKDDGLCAECGGQVALVVGFESADELVCVKCGAVLGLVDSHEVGPTILKGGRPVGDESERVYPVKACGYCQTVFRPKKSQHVYCGSTCRKRAERLRIRLETLIGLKASRRWLKNHIQESAQNPIETKQAEITVEA